jgi:polyribonucleotide nucleotidyltransferase
MCISRRSLAAFFVPEALLGETVGQHPLITVLDVQKFEGTVTSIAPFGAFLELKEGVEGLLHASEIGEGEHCFSKCSR